MSHNTAGACEFKVRRATNEDLPALKLLWSADRLAADSLEKKFGEFQVVETSAGEIVAALALQREGKDGLIHSETYKDFALSDTIRPLLWERFQNMINNHGLYRVWTRETAPLWKQLGFRAPRKQESVRLPASFGATDPGLLYLQLKDEDAIVSLEKEFEMFRRSEQARTAELLSTAKGMKTLAMFIAIIVFLLIIGCTIYLVKSGNLLRR